MDVDPSGNIWFDYSVNTSSLFGDGVGEIKTPTTKPAFVSVILPGSIQQPGGVYVSNGGTVLNVTDQKLATISQYALPWVPSETPFNVLGPTPPNAFGAGEPVSGGFNKTDTLLAEGDAYGWLDIGEVTNRWHAVANINFSPSLGGAAYTPSDK
jgi:hypothetical protein